MIRSGTRRPTTWLFPLLAVVMLLAASCADSEDGTEAGVDQDAVNEVLQDTESAEDTEDPPAEDGTEEDAEFSGDDSGDFCKLAQELEETTEEFGDSSDPADVETMMQTTLDGFERAKAAAPDEIRDAVLLSADTFKLLDDELKKVNYSLLDLDLAVLGNLETEEFEAADYAISVYNFEVCGIGEAPEIDDEPDDNEPLPEGSARDQIAEGLINSGFTAAEAECLISKLDPANLEEFTDPQVMLGLFAECDIALERLAELGG